jgi:hypothetical protein
LGITELQLIRPAERVSETMASFVGFLMFVGETGALAGMLTINAASVDTSNRLRDAHLGANNSSTSRGNRRSRLPAPNVPPTVHNSRVRRR